MQIAVTLRNGNHYVLILERADTDAERVFDELAAGRSQALRGWVAVRSTTTAEKIVVLGEEIVELQLVDDDTVT